MNRSWPELHAKVGAPLGPPDLVPSNTSVAFWARPFEHAIVAVNGRSTHVRRMKWDTFVGALGRRPLVLTVAKTTETPFEAAQLLDVAGTGGGGVMMNMSTGETKFTVQVDDPEAFKAFITDLQQYNAKQQAQAVAGPRGCTGSPLPGRPIRPAHSSTSGVLFPLPTTCCLRLRRVLGVPPRA